MAYYAIITFFIVITVTASYSCIKLFFPVSSIGSFAELFTAIIALLAFIIAFLEYSSSKDMKEVQILSEYNKRFSEDPNIVKVTQYLNYIDVDGSINNPHRCIPSNYEVEIFMRFFEELELQISYGRLNEEDVLNLFIYYAKKISENNELRNHLGITDYDENWELFKRITDRKNTK